MPVRTDVVSAEGGSPGKRSKPGELTTNVEGFSGAVSVYPVFSDKLFHSKACFRLVSVSTSWAGWSETRRARPGSVARTPAKRMVGLCWSRPGAGGGGTP